MNSSHLSHLIILLFLSFLSLINLKRRRCSDTSSGASGSALGGEDVKTAQLPTAGRQFHATLTDILPGTNRLNFGLHRKLHIKMDDMRA